MTKAHAKRDDDEFSQLDPLSTVVDGAVMSGMEAEGAAMPVSLHPSRNPKGSLYNNPPKMRRDELATPTQQSASSSTPTPSQSAKPKSFLSELMGKHGLGSIMGHAHHGVGLFPVSTSELQKTSRH